LFNKKIIIKMSTSGEQKEMTRKEKLAFLGLVVLAVFVVYLGFRQMGNNLKTPFALFALQHSVGEQISFDQNFANEELKKKDTDADGLKDYDELYIYQTSPYLTDTDSDGLNDKTEADSGSDPNCPKGQDCYGSLVQNQAAANTATSSLEISVSELPTADQILLQNLLGSNPDPKVLRDFLIQNGIDSKELEKFSDNDLLAFFKEFVSSTSTAANNSESSDFSLDISNVDLKALRKSLLEKGIPKETLDGLDDQALLDLIKQL